jgi:Right handed beta helix region
VALASGCATGLTSRAGPVTGTAALVSGEVISDTGGEIEYWFEYGPTTAYGSQTAHDTVTADANETRVAIDRIEGLERSTTYHMRVCASDSQQQGGPRCGDDAQFTTFPVDCGDAITSDLVLPGDLECEAVGELDGLLIGAHGVNLNLAGHRITAGLTAIENAGFDDVTIRNGTALSHGSGVLLEGASRNRVLDMRAGSSGRDWETGVGVAVQGGADNLIRGGGFSGTGAGIRDSSLRVIVRGVSASGRFGSGVELGGDFGRVVDSSLGSAFGVGLDVTGSGNAVLRNSAGAGVGIYVAAGTENVIGENRAIGSRDPFSAEPTEGALGDGIFVQATAVRTLLRGNVASENMSDGIEAQSATTRLRDNVANDNGVFGIDAVPGVVDLGGNTASGNGATPQCRNVFCP